MLFTAIGSLRAEILRQIREMGVVWHTDRKARSRVWVAAGAALSVILLAILIDIARFLDFHHFEAGFFSLTYDRSLPELVMDALALWAGALALILHRATGLRTYAVMAATLVFLSLDDFWSVHELLGAFYADNVHISTHYGIEPQAIGELLAFATFALAFVPLGIWAVLRLTITDAAIGVIYGAAFGLLVFFAVVADLIHGMIENSIAFRLMGWVEDGGEIVAVCIVAILLILQESAKPRSRR